MNLTAKFKYSLSGFGLLICKDLFEELNFSTQMNNFKVFIDLNPDWGTYKVSSFGLPSDPPYYSLHKIKLKVSRFEDLLEEMDSKKDIIGIQNLILAHRIEYINTAVNILNNLIYYFKYQLNNPNLSFIGNYDKQLIEPDWFNDKDDKYKFNFGFGIGTNLQKISSFGIDCYTDEKSLDLQSALTKKTEVFLFQELISDAQSAVFENNIRRGAMELAIATEVLVKNFFFEQNSIASDVYEFLSERHKVTVRVDELIDGAAKQSIGESFKQNNKPEFDNIVELFRCRNKIAHHGKIEYTDMNGNKKQLTEEILEEWWSSVLVLSNWLSSRSIHSNND